MYLILKSLHVLAVALFLGNIITGVFWRFHAERSRDPKYIGLTFEGISRSDRFFTIPGVLLIIVTGVWAAIEGGLRSCAPVGSCGRSCYSRCPG